jgi:hypothetical protein
MYIIDDAGLLHSVQLLLLEIGLFTMVVDHGIVIVDIIYTI